MKVLKFLLIIVCLFSFSTTYAQVSENEAFVEKNSLSVNILGTASYLGVSYERLFAQRFSVDFGIGLIGIGVGGTLYPFKKVQVNKFNPFVGIKYTNHAIVDGENKSATYLPLGVTYFSRYRLNFSVDVGPSYFRHKSPGYMPTQEELEKYPYNSVGLWGNLKIGFRF